MDTKEQPLHCRAAAAATAIFTVVFLFSLLCAFPQTPRRCYRSTNDASQIRQGLSRILRPVFRPGSRAALATTNRNNSNTYVADRGHPADISHIGEWQVGESHPADTNQQLSSEVILPWILGGLLLVSVAGSLCHMMPGLGGGSRMKNSNYRIPPSWTPENNSSYGFRVHMTDISHGAMPSDPARINDARPSPCA